MDEWKTFFRFSKREQQAIFTLLALSGMLLLFIYFNGKIISDHLLQITEADSLFLKNTIQLINSDLPHDQQAEERFDPLLASYAMAKSTLNPFPFNPNQLSAEEWKKLGLSDRQIRNIKNYEAKGGKFYSKEDFGRLYSISPEEYDILEPFIRIPPPDSAAGRNSRFAKQIMAESPLPEKVPRPAPIPINSADSASLESLPLIGKWTAHRILKYRSSLGGFVSSEQLREINGMDETKFQMIINYIEIDTNNIVPLKINRLDFNKLIKHPYLEFAQVKKIVTHRERRGFIRNSEELKTIAELSDDELSRLQPYVNFE